ncbi:exodeoxyribonuclease VII small subunit [Oryzobacter terrae]|uniref:exodeoxyribonuclease VII small subunit n=1 Tax=Oryzobacter terrae TaxID=1620385 RepID=UPI00366FF5E6
MAKKAQTTDPAGAEADATPDVDPGVEAAVEATTEHADVAAMGYEQARDELVDIVARLENGQAGLEESMRLWERGEVLATHCGRWLDAAEARVTGQD